MLLEVEPPERASLSHNRVMMELKDDYVIKFPF